MSQSLLAPDVTTWSVKDIPSHRKATVKPDKVGEVVGGVETSNIHLIICSFNTRLE